MSYDLSRRLPSCFITKDVILELEAFGTKKERAYRQSSNDGVGRFKLEIRDKNGAEELKTIEDYGRALFPDNVQAIKLAWGVRGYDALHLELNFSVQRWQSEVNIWIDGEGARETCEGIYGEIASILKHAQTLNWLFNGGWRVMWWIVIWLLLMVPVALAFRDAPTMRAAGLSFIVSIVSWILIDGLINIFKPYTVFDSKRNAQRRKQFAWVTLLILSYLLVTVAGVYLRIKLLGF